MAKKKYQVFVSSTFTDLREERQAAVSAILGAGHIPAGMELFTAGSDSQWEVIKRWIDQSDIYMLILGGRYGSLHPSGEYSYTEMEYDYAVKAGKPVFAAVLSDSFIDSKVAVDGRAMIESDNGAKYKAFKSRVMSLMVRPCVDIKDVSLSVHESLPTFESTHKLVGWISASDFSDPVALIDEISRLATENANLKKEIKRTESTGVIKRKLTFNFDELSGILRNLVVEGLKLYASDTDHSVLDLLLKFRSSFISEYVRTGTGDQIIQALFSRVSPALIVHGLVESWPGPSLREVVIRVTPKGLEFLAECDARAAGF